MAEPPPLDAAPPPVERVLAKLQAASDELRRVAASFDACETELTALIRQGTEAVESAPGGPASEEAARALLRSFTPAYLLHRAATLARVLPRLAAEVEPHFLPTPEDLDEWMRGDGQPLARWRLSAAHEALLLAERELREARAQQLRLAKSELEPRPTPEEVQCWLGWAGYLHLLLRYQVEPASAASAILLHGDEPETAEPTSLYSSSSVPRAAEELEELSARLTAGLAGLEAAARAGAPSQEAEALAKLSRGAALPQIHSLSLLLRHLGLRAPAYAAPIPLLQARMADLGRRLRSSGGELRELAIAARVAASSDASQGRSREAVFTEWLERFSQELLTEHLAPTIARLEAAARATPGEFPVRPDSSAVERLLSEIDPLSWPAQG